MGITALIIFLGLATVFAIAFYFASGFKRSTPLYVVTYLFVIIGYSAYALGYFALLRSVLFAVCLNALLVAVLHDLIIVTKEPIDKKYFDLLNFVALIFCIPVIIKVLRKGLSADDIWFVTFIFLPAFGYVCRNANKNHSPTFLVTGISAIFIAISCMVLHPLVSGACLSVENLLISFKLGGAWYIFYGAFFLANYAKLGLLSDSAIHKKVFGIYVAFIVINLTTRFPVLEPFKDLSAIKGLTEASTFGLFFIPPSLGLFLKRNKKTPNE